jgi:uncharacterized protein YfaT (DUF1175 family)
MEKIQSLHHKITHTTNLKIIALICISVFVLNNTLQAQQTNTEQLRSTIIQKANGYLGTPYIYGNESPSGFDCSGFVRYVYRLSGGPTLPRNAAGQWAGGAAIPLKNAKPGDILVFNTSGSGASHVGILLDKERFIHAASDGPHTGVIISSIQERYYASRLMGVRAWITDPSQAETQQETSPSQQAQQPHRENEQLALSLIRLSISKTPSIMTDPIPTATGSSASFVLTNDSGRDGVFEVLFYKMHPDFSQTRTLKQYRIHISANEYHVTDPLFFAESGQYRLIIKTHDNLKRVERTWKVVSVQ